MTVHRRALPEVHRLVHRAPEAWRRAWLATAVAWLTPRLAIRPDVVILHDPFWRPISVTREAHRLGAAVIAVHHASPALHAAGIPGPDALYLPALRRIYQLAYEHVDAVMSTLDP